jgi:MFS family permease
MDGEEKVGESSGISSCDSGKAEAQAPIGAIFLTIFIDLVGFSIIFPLMPAILQWYLPREGAGSLVGRMEGWLTSVSPAAMGASGSVLAIVLFGGALGSIFSILQFVSSPVWGRLSDRFGRRRILLITTSCTCIGYVIWVFSGNFWLFVLCRFTCGMMAGNISVATAAMADATSRSKRTGGMAILGVAFALGFMIGPAIGGLASLIRIDSYFPWTTFFGINPFSGAALVSVTLALVNFFWVLFFFPETLKKENRRIHAISMNPLSNLMVDKGPVRRVIFVDFSFITIFSGIEFTVTFLALERLNFGPAQNIAIFIFSGVIITVVQFFFTHKNVARMKQGNLVCLGVFLGLSSAVTLAFASTVTSFFIGLFLKACGVAMLAPTITSLVSLYSPPTKQGAVMGTFRATGSLGRAIGPVIASVFYWAFGSCRTYLLASMLLLLPLYLASRLPEPEKAKDDK